MLICFAIRGNFGSWNNPVMPNTFGAQVYDLGDPWSQVGDGNPRKLDQTTGKTIGLRCCGWSVNAQAVPPYAFPYWGNCSGTANGGACSDKYNCSLPEIGHDGDPIAGKYGSMCAAWDESAWSPSLRPLAALVRANNPSGLEGNNFMGGIRLCVLNGGFCIQNNGFVLKIMDFGRDPPADQAAGRAAAGVQRRPHAQEAGTARGGTRRHDRPRH